MKQHEGPFSRRLRNARVQAMERRGNVFHGGPVLGERPASMRLRHARGRRVIDTFAPELVDPVTLRGSYAYLGIAFGHFGHIMSETIHRIVPTRQIDPDPAWLIMARRGARAEFAALPTLCQSVLALFGVDATNCTVVSADTIVEELLIVEAGSNLGGGPKGWYLDLLRDKGPIQLTPDAGYPEKVYVSRSGLAHRSGLLGEEVLEEALSDAGFHIMHSQTLPVAEQFAHYAHAKVLMFAEGSACHGVEVLGRGALGHAIIMNRRARTHPQFDRVLASRSARFDSFVGNRYLGSLVHGGKDVAKEARGVSVLALDALATFLDEIDVATLDRVSPIKYLAAAHADLERYLASLGEVGTGSAANDLRAALCDTIAAGGTIVPAAPPLSVKERRALRRSREAARSKPKGLASK